MKKSFAGRRMAALGLACMIFLSGCTGAGASEKIQGTEETEKTVNVVSEQFDTYIDEMFRAEVVENTINLHYILAYPKNYGITDYEVSLGDFSLEEIEKSYSELEDLKQELSQFNRKELTKSQKLTYDILMDYADTELETKDLMLYTEFLNPTTGYQAQLPVILAEYTFRTKQDIEDYLVLISQMDELYADIIAFEKEKSKAGLFMPDYAVDAVIDQCEQFMEDPENNYMIEVFNDVMEAFEGITEEEKEAYRQKNHTIITTEVMAGYQILIDGLTSLKGTGTNDKGLCYYENGKEYYEYLIRTGVGSELSVEEMQKQTEDYIMDCIRNIAVTLEAKPEIISELADYEFPVTEPVAILEDLKQKMLTDFPEPPEVNYTVKSIHPSMEEHASPAFYLTTPIDDITNNTIYINESYLGENPQMDLYTTLAHEGYPGHLYQNAYTASNGLAPVRSLFSCSGYVEGWATYVEHYAYGISGLEKNLASVLAWNNAASLGMYAYADMGINYDGWDREDLAEYLAGFGFADEEIVNSIYEAMVGDPANYLNYFIGYLEILNLRDEMKEKMGDDFVLKDFHEAFLAAGPAPFYMLDDYLLDSVGESEEADVQEDDTALDVAETQEPADVQNSEVGQLGGRGDYYSEKFPTDAEKETIVYETVADVTHDGTGDFIQLAAYSANSYENVTQLLESVTSVSYVKVYRGIDGREFEEEPLFISRAFSSAHTGNGTVCLAQKDGYDYLLFSNINESQGYANYSYEVVYISEEDGIVTEDSDTVDFAVEEAPHIDWENEPHREDVVPEFREKIAPWTADAAVIVSLDIDRGVLVSTEAEEVPASVFFDEVWERE